MLSGTFPPKLEDISGCFSSMNSRSAVDELLLHMFVCCRSFK